MESLLSQHAQVHAAGERPEWAEALTTVLNKHAIARPFPGCMRDLSPAQIAEIGESYLEALSDRAPDRRFVVNTIPEPATLALMAFGGLALLRRRA